jgi:hypothetical protein
MAGDSAPRRRSRVNRIILEVARSEVRVHFVRQQGFEDANARTCDVQYPALMFQPRVIGVLVLAGVLLQSPLLFLTLAAILWWSAPVPQMNPFETVYNGLFQAAKTGTWEIVAD